MKRHIRSASAFTLVEMLVVIGIVFLCAALMVPLIAAKQAQNDRTLCLNNLKMVAIALESYTSDYGNYFPCKAAYGAASASYDKHGCKVEMDHGLWPNHGQEMVLTNQVACAKFSDSENCGVEDEMCIAFGANADPTKRRVNEDRGPAQVGPVGLGYLVWGNYIGDLKPFYCPAWNLPSTRFQESCGQDMCPDGKTVGNGQINSLATAELLGGLDREHLLNGNYHRASVTRAGKEAEGWYVKCGALGVQSSYVYRNQAVRQPPDADDQVRLPVYYAKPTITTATGCPSFKTTKQLGGRAIVADTFLRSYQDVKAEKPGYVAYHHKEGYNALYGDAAVRWYGDPDGVIMGFVQGPKGDGMPVTPEGDSAPFDKASARCGTAAGVFVDTALKGAGQTSGRAAVWHLFDVAAGIDAENTPLPQDAP